MLVSKTSAARAAASCRGRRRLPRRLRRLIVEAFECRGDVPRLLGRLKMRPRTLAQRISALRGLRLARTVILFDPRLAGRPLECIVRVRLSAYAPQVVRAFEQRLIDDPDVVHADQICGRFDYQLSVFHPHARAAAAWCRAVEGWPDVAKVEPRLVRTLFGCASGGLPLRGTEILGSRRLRESSARTS